MSKHFTTLIFFLHLSLYVFAQGEKAADTSSLSLVMGQTPAETVINIGKAFIGKPYVPHTLDGSSAEQLVVDMQQFDCTTYLETTLALTLAAHQQNGKLNTDQFEVVFRRMLTQLRYRSGVIDGYASRLHYFSDWLIDNEKKGLVRDVTRQIGGMQVSKPVNYMTTCTWKYPQLTDPTVYRQIAQVEEALNKQSFWFIPKAKIRDVEQNLRDGDIIMLTAARPGLDMKHVGFALWQIGPDGQRRVYLLHASSEFGGVMITRQPLADYVQWNKRLSGIRVARLNTAMPSAMVRATR